MNAFTPILTWNKLWCAASLRQGLSVDSLYVLHLTGSTMRHVSCSNNAVYALDNTGQVYMRLGIKPKNLAGSAWRKIPGVMSKLAGNILFCLVLLLCEYQEWY